MDRLVVFRFHKDFEVCKNRLELLDHFNPGIRIVGLYGGKPEHAAEAKRELSDHLSGFYEIPVQSTDWKWKNGDLSLRRWYQEEGKDLPFDTIHLIEWDLLVLDNLDKLYSHVPKDGVGLTALTDVRKIEGSWWWTAAEPHRSEWNRLVKHVRKEFDYKQPLYACQGPANSFSRAFLDQYATHEIPELVHEELRLPLFTLAFGLPLANNAQFYAEIFNRKDWPYFNCEEIQVQEKTIRRELADPNGRRVFHPYQNVFSL